MNLKILNHVLNTRGHCRDVFPNIVFFFSLNRPHWADSVIESPCPSVCGSVCLFVCTIGCIFFRPLIGPDQFQASHWSNLGPSKNIYKKIKITEGPFLSVLVLVLLSASVERFSVSRMRYFLLFFSFST